jgi:hypothetical protein
MESTEAAPEELIETGIRKKRKSRWVKGSGVPRYDKKTLDVIMDKYVETPPFRHGAKVEVKK